MPYEFTQEGFREFSEAILGTNGDQASLTTILADMQDTFTDSIAALTTAKANEEAMGKERDRLKEANMDLFLRVGAYQQEKPSDKLKETPAIGTSEYMKKFFEGQK